MTLKRLLCSIFIILICMMLFINGYVKSSSITYAATNWENVTTNEELVEAFKYYCKSRDLTIDGSLADGVTYFTTKTFNGICNSLGINITALQAHLKKDTDTNNGLKFLFDSTGISAYNAIFAQFLQDNRLSVGDSASEQNNTIYSGKYINYLGYKCFAYITNTSNGYVGSNAVLAKGTYYKYSTDYIYANNTITLSFDYYASESATTVSTINAYPKLQWNSDNTLYDLKIYKNSTFKNNYGTIKSTNTLNAMNGEICIYYNVSNDSYFIGLVSDISNPTNASWVYYINYFTQIYKLNGRNSTVYLTTNNTVINNNNYEGDTIINNNGDTIVNEPIPDDPETPPYDPYPGGGGTTTPDDNVGGGDESDDTNITFPNFEFNFPEIDWSIGDLSQKFPFSIPFDLIAFFTVLNAEPEAPKIDADIPLGNWYTWHFTADFSQFDRYASIVRHVEFISFVVALIYLTIRLVKG